MGQFLFWKWEDKKKEPFKLITSKPDREFLEIISEYVREVKSGKREKLVLVLPGGGSRGRWQFGVIYWLHQIGLLEHVELICATSVGGLNAVMIAKNIKNIDKVLNMWNNITKNSDIYKGMLQFNNAFDIMGMIGQIFKDNKGKYILDSPGLKSILKNELGDSTVVDLDIPIAITSTDITTGSYVEFSKDKTPNDLACDVAEATSKIPVIFGSKKRKDKAGRAHKLVDGGVGRNNPTKLALDNGATKVILIGTSPDTIESDFDIKDSLLAEGGRLESVLMHLFEEHAWDSIEDYKKFHELAPDKYPSVEFMDIYPQDNKMQIEYEVNALDFENVMTLQWGYNYAVKIITPKRLKAFLLK